MLRPLTIFDPKEGTRFAEHNGRLALFQDCQNHVEYWKEYWSPEKRRHLLTEGFLGKLGEFTDIFERFLPRNGRILEAGCGVGYIVAALQTRGYDAFGVDYEPEVVGVVNRECPSLHIKQDDVLKLGVMTGELAAYISLGVLEHFQDGPQKALSEAARVLSLNGVAIVSVPYLNPMRKRMLAELRRRGRQAEGYFYQYYFSVEEFTSYLAAAGFEVVGLFAYGVDAFLTREHPMFTKVWGSAWAKGMFKTPLRKFMRHAPMPFRTKYGHMMMYVCRRIGSP
jgi:SAM-dependent methyltransferase